MQLYAILQVFHQKEEQVAKKTMFIAPCPHMYAGFIIARHNINTTAATAVKG